MFVLRILADAIWMSRSMARANDKGKHRWDPDVFRDGFRLRLCLSRRAVRRQLAGGCKLRILNDILEV